MISKSKFKFSFHIAGVVSVISTVLFILSSCNAIAADEDASIKQEAVNAYTLFTIDHPKHEYFLYVLDGKIVTIEKGIATGVYEKRDDAMQAMLDDPSTDANEAEYYSAISTSLDGLYFCTRGAHDSAMLQGAKNAYISYIVNHIDQQNTYFIYEQNGCFLTIKNGSISETTSTSKDAAMATLFGEKAPLYRTEETEIPGLFMCLTNQGLDTE